MVSVIKDYKNSIFINKVDGSVEVFDFLKSNVFQFFI